MKALARKASKLAIYGAAGLCARKSGASDKILKLCRRCGFAAKIGAGGLVCATPLALKLGAGVALKFAARKILTFGICELSKSAALKCAKLGARAVVRSFSRIDKFTDERSKKHTSADNENFNAGITPHRKRTASVSSASIKKDASLSKSASDKKNVAIKNVPAKKSAPSTKSTLIAKNIAASAAPISTAKSPSVAKSALIKNAVQNKISAASAKVAPAKSASQNAKSHRVAKNTATPTAAAAKNVAATTASSAPTAKQSRRAAKSASLKSSTAGKP